MRMTRVAMALPVTMAVSMPVWMIVPAGVWTATAMHPGMLCVTCRNSSRRGPIVIVSRGATGVSRPAASTPCSTSFGCTG